MLSNDWLSIYRLYIMLSNDWLSIYRLLENLNIEKSIFDGVLDFNLSPHPPSKHIGLRCHIVKANPSGHLRSKYQYFLIRVVNIYTGRKLEHRKSHF